MLDRNGHFLDPLPQIPKLPALRFRSGGDNGGLS